MEKDTALNEKGIGLVLILVAVVILVVIVIITFFLFRGGNSATTPQPTPSGQSEDEISDEEVPLKICETGDPEQCHDPVSNEDVDNIRSTEDEYP